MKVDYNHEPSADAESSDDEGSSAAESAAVIPYAGFSSISPATGHQPAEAAADFAMHAVEGRDLRRDFQACADFDGGRSFFARKKEEIKAALCVAYAPFLHLKVDRKAAWVEVGKASAFEGRRRAPKEDALASVAIQLVTRPVDNQERSSLSDYAYVLKWAEVTGITPDAFEKWVQGVSCKECKDSFLAHQGPKKGGGPKASHLQFSLKVTGAEKPMPVKMDLTEAEAAALSSYLADHTGPFANAAHVLGVLQDVLLKAGKACEAGDLDTEEARLAA